MNNVTPTSRQRLANRRHSETFVAVSDGRHACGTVQPTSAGFVATDIAGRVIGIFPSLKEATRALPSVVAP